MAKDRLDIKEKVGVSIVAGIIFTKNGKDC